MAESVNVDALAATLKHFQGDGDLAGNLGPEFQIGAMQSWEAPAPDADEYTMPGAYAEGQTVSGASFGNMPAEPGSIATPGQPEGGLGGGGSTGIVGENVTG